MISYQSLPRLTEIRKAKGWSVQELSDRSGYSEVTIRNAEGRISTMGGVKAKTASEIAQALGVTLEDLLGRKLPKPAQMHKSYQRRLLKALDMMP